MARYKQLLFFAAKLPALPKEQQIPTNKVEGCVSQVWVVAELQDDGNVYWKADSDSQLTKVCDGNGLFWVFLCYCRCHYFILFFVCVERVSHPHVVPCSSICRGHHPPHLLINPRFSCAPMTHTHKYTHTHAHLCVSSPGSCSATGTRPVWCSSSRYCGIGCRFHRGTWLEASTHPIPQQRVSQYV